MSTAAGLIWALLGLVLLAAAITVAALLLVARAELLSTIRNEVG